MLDLATVRACFPALSTTTADGAPVVHADAPGGTQVPQQVIAAMAGYLEAGNANAHGHFARSRQTDALCAQVRDQVAAFVEGTPDGVVFGPNMTTLTYHFADALSRTFDAGDRIVCTRLDHDANVSPWLHLARRTGAEIDWVDLDPGTGTLDLDTLRVGDALDFWRVIDVRRPTARRPGLLRLLAEMRLPGRAWLEFRVVAVEGGSELHQRALFAPRGLLGRLYWWVLVPFHGMIFPTMATTLARRAEQLATSSGAPTAPPAAPGDDPAAADPDQRRARRAG